MRQVKDFFQPAADRTLYHYTSISGLMGMVADRAVWAGHAYYLNDTKEIVHAVDGITQKLKQYIDPLGGDDEFVEQLLEWLKSFRHNPYHIFVFSLSEERSLLSQWRSYTPHGKGVSLGFSAETLNHLLTRQGFRLAKCLYSRDEQDQLLSSFMEMLFASFHQVGVLARNKNAHPTQSYHDFLEGFRGDFLQVLAIVKDEAFREEREWRILSPYYANYTGSEVQFRPGASMIMPYTVLDLPKVGRLFAEVILGPSRDVSLSMAALATYLTNKKVCNMTFNSQIPYRQW